MAKLVSKTYGDALFEVALESGRMDEFRDEAVAVKAALNENPELFKLMSHPKIVKEEKVKIVEDIFAEKISAEFVGLLRLIVEKGVVFVDKYQEVNKIVDEILKQIGEEIKNASGGVKQKLQVLAVYSLAENEMQLPFAVTLSSILSENEKVLLLDLQENSGLSQLMGEFYSSGMEELLVMAESGKYSKSRMVSCIGHLDRTDVVYPLGNTECLCEVKNLTYQKLFQILAQEMNYTTIVLNLGSRFMGFFELLGSCQKIFLMKSRGGLGQWREKEFLTEIQKRGEERLSENLREIQLPPVATPVVSCERLVEQWKWNEFGDSIRRMMPVG